MKKTSRQINIVHLSDIHFGEPHRFQPTQSPAGDRGSSAGYLSLLDSLRLDWAEQTDNGAEAVVAVTGDLTCKALPQEYTEVRRFLDGICNQKARGKPIRKENIFVVPGNHDVLWTEPDMVTRWSQYCAFYRDFYADDGGQVLPGRALNSNKPQTLSRVHDRSEDLGLVVAELNSCLHVMKDSPDEHRGQITQEEIQAVHDQLERIPRQRLERSIRVALIHHHPILIPSFAEPKRGYDSVLNAPSLLGVLREFGFHVILHGHKHYPHTFTYDASCAWITDEAGPMMIVSGGSAGSNELPEGKNAANTYNLLTIKWNWGAKEARVHVETRGLQIYRKNGQMLLPGKWHWFELREIDRLLRGRRGGARAVFHDEPFDAGGGDASYEAERMSVYTALRLNMPVVEVVPSLNAGQEYEAQVWIAPHAKDGASVRKDEDIPEEVVWSAGPHFKKVARCLPTENPDFRAKFDFYGPMLIQARLRFKDGEVAKGYVYAHMPRHGNIGTKEVKSSAPKE